VGHHSDMVPGSQGNLDLNKFWEVEGNAVHLPVQITDTQGRLKQNVEFWHTILHAPPSIIDCLENSYCLPLKFVSLLYSQQNHKFVELYKEFINNAVQELISNRCVMTGEAKPELCSPLSVVANSQGKLNLVLI